jgi:hypothetical protein
VPSSTGRRRRSCTVSGLTSIDDLPALAPYLPEVDALDDPDGGLA